MRDAQSARIWNKECLVCPANCGLPGVAVKQYLSAGASTSIEDYA